MLVRLCLFWVKITSGNAFPEMRLFGWSGKFYFPEIEIRWPKKNAFEHGNHFTLLFSLQSISRKFYRERESARAREPAQSDDRDLVNKHSSRRWSRSRHHEIAPLIAISPSRDRTGSRSQSTARSHEASIARSRKRKIATTAREEDRDLAKKARSRSCRRTGFVAGLDLGCGLCFSGFMFSFFFSKHQKIFSEIFFEMQPNTWNHFSFPEISISGKYLFSKKRFRLQMGGMSHETETLHSKK